jgi:hypothetical protein
MIGFNVLLEYVELNPAMVKLVRHQDSRYLGRRTP